jgi:hypothetical protein
VVDVLLGVLIDTNGSIASRCASLWLL